MVRNEKTEASLSEDRDWNKISRGFFVCLFLSRLWINEQTERRSDAANVAKDDLSWTNRNVSGCIYRYFLSCLFIFWHTVGWIVIMTICRYPPLTTGGCPLFCTVWCVCFCLRRVKLDTHQWGCRLVVMTGDSHVALLAFKTCHRH